MCSYVQMAQMITSQWDQSPWDRAQVSRYTLFQGAMTTALCGNCGPYLELGHTRLCRNPFLNSAFGH